MNLKMNVKKQPTKTFYLFFQELPTAENFTFMFNTGITELVSLYPVHRSRILAVQYKLVQDLIKTLSNASTFSINNINIVKTITSTQLVEAKVDAAKACRVLVPVLIGLLRSIGRISALENTSLLSLIYHANHLNAYIQQNDDTQDSMPKSNFTGVNISILN